MLTPHDPVPAPAPSPAAAPFGRLGGLEVRLADPEEIAEAQRLRYRVFFEEGGATASRAARASRRDADGFDAVCDHLVVVDRTGPEPQVVGTCRLLRQAVAEANGGFYTASEFDLASLVARHPGLRFLELGRSCVAAAHRGKRTAELLWHGIWSYALRHRMDVMIGCGSLAGTDPEALALPLAFLHHHARAPEGWEAEALPDLRVDMNRLPADGLDARAALRALPPLLKGYLRLGAHVGGSAVVDAAFGTTDVLVILPVAAISGRYIGHYGAEAERYAA